MAQTHVSAKPKVTRAWGIITRSLLGSFATNARANKPVVLTRASDIGAR